MPWQADSYSPIDFSLIDPHWGTLDDWRNLVDEMHSRGMYIMLDFTVGTMSDFIAFKEYVSSFAARQSVRWSLTSVLPFFTFKPPQLFDSV
jgi:alpha-1,3-glucan synthase